MPPPQKPQYEWQWDRVRCPSNIQLESGNRVARRKNPETEMIKDLVALSKRPIRLFTSEIMEFHVKLVDTCIRCFFAEVVV